MQENYLWNLLKEHRENQDIARKNLEEFYTLLKDAKENKEYKNSSLHLNSNYTSYIPILYKALLKKDYVLVCNELIGVLGYNNHCGNLWQIRDKNALLILLEKEFNND